MINQRVFIFNPVSIGSGKYTFELYFTPSSQAKFLNLGDTIKDTLNREYQIVTPTVIQHTDGAVVTAQFITSDVLPTADVDYNSTAYTPGQVELRPYLRTSGTLGTATVFSGPNYEYTLTFSPAISAEANKAEVGDSILDSVGKEFVITFLHVTSRFNVAIRVTEKERVGIAPVAGGGTLFRDTNNYGFFQGTEVSDPARNNINIRDRVILDYKIKELEDSISLSSSSAIEKTYTNGSGGTLTKAQPIRIKSDGDISSIDVSQESHIFGAIGVAKAVIANAVPGVAVVFGLLEDITTTASVGETVYISKTGGLTSTKPEEGSGGFVAGDFVVQVGVIAENASNPVKKDLVVCMKTIGQL